MILIYFNFNGSNYESFLKLWYFNYVMIWYFIYVQWIFLDLTPRRIRKWMVSIWKFPKMGVPPNHPFPDGIFPCRPSIWGIPHFRKPPHIYLSINLSIYLFIYLIIYIYIYIHTCFSFNWFCYMRGLEHCLDWGHTLERRDAERRMSGLLLICDFLVAIQALPTPDR